MLAVQIHLRTYLIMIQNNGFAVIASDNRVFPLLAFSETGHFAYVENENDPIYANFISRIDDLLATVDDNDTIVSIPDDFISTCSWTTPLLETSNWHQSSPFNKYVEIEHPGCPAGCVAVAAGQIMINCKKKFTYKDFSFRSNAIKRGLGWQTRIVGGWDPDTLTYSYETAIDQVAKLLYWVGKDINTQYSPSGSGAQSSYALKLLKEVGFKVKEQYLTSLSDTAIVNRIDEQYLI